MEKYKLTNKTINVQGRILYRIEALRDFNDVRKGDKGGFIENERNLSQDGDCWVYDNAMVYGDARVCGNASVFGDASVFDNAEVHGDARVYGNAFVFGYAFVCDNATVYDNAKLCDYAKVCDYAMVCGDARVYGRADVCGDARIESMRDYIVFKNWWSSGRYFTWTRSNNMWRVGCFYGSGEKLIQKAYKDSKESGDEYKAVVEYVKSRL